MKGFYIQITNNLLEPKHRKNIGIAVWEFMWFLDKITKIDEDGTGWVLGGNLIQLKDIAEDLGITEKNVSKNINKLKRNGYIDITYLSHGIVIKVWKAKKRFAKKDLRFAKRGIPQPYIDNTDIYKDNVVPNDTTDSIKSQIEEMDWKKFCQWCSTSKQKHIQIIGAWAEAVKPDLKTKNQWEAFMNRHFRAAKVLVPFTEEQLGKAFAQIKKAQEEGWLKKYTLETLTKFIL